MWENAIIVKDYLLDGVTEGEEYGAVKMDYNRLSAWQNNVEHDILKTAQLIPGVTSVDESATNLSIRGSSADQNLLLWEGAKLYEPGHLFGMISAVNPFVVSSMKLFKGVSEPSYGNVVGGIIDLSLSDSVSTVLEGGLGTTWTEAHGYLAVPLVRKKMSLLLSGRNTIQGLIPSPTLSSYSAKVFQDSKIEEEEEEEESREQLLNFYDWNAKLLFRPNDHFFFKASYFRSSDEFNFESTLLEEEWSTIDIATSSTEAVSFSAEMKHTEGWSSKFAFANSAYQSDYRFAIISLDDEFEVFANDIYNDIVDRTLSWSSRVMLKKVGNLDFGYEFNRKRVNYNIREESAFEFEYDDFNAAAGHFHNFHSAISLEKKAWQMNGGIRAIYYRELDTWSFSPRFNLQYKLQPFLKLKISAGILHQYISQLKEFGDNDLGINNQVWILNRTEGESEATQRAGKFSIGFLYKKNGWLLDVDGYRNKVTGLHTFSPLFGIDSEEDFSTGSSTALGIDLLLKKRLNNYQVWANYSLSDADFFFPEIEEATFPATNAQRHNLSLINSWKQENWNFSISYHYRTGLPYSYAEEVVPFQEEDEIYYGIEYESLNGEKLPEYERLDLGISYRAGLRNNKLKLEAAFSIINLLNRENIFGRDYYLDDVDEGDAEPELFFVDKQMLRRTPQLLLRLHW
ncbi:MAG: TonB-dependent receptor [Pseudomonadota bacterium]